MHLYGGISNKHTAHPNTLIIVDDFNHSNSILPNFHHHVKFLTLGENKQDLVAANV